MRFRHRKGKNHFQMDNREEFEHNAVRRQFERRYANGFAERNQTRNRELPRPLQTTLQVILFKETTDCYLKKFFLA